MSYFEIFPCEDLEEIQFFTAKGKIVLENITIVIEYESVDFGVEQSNILEILDTIIQ